jgi:nitrite reductase (NADH) small subunit
MPQFTTIARVGEVPEGQGRTYRVGDRSIAIFCVGGKYFALDDFCPHMGDSLGSGEVCGQTIICNQHRWAFSMVDGASPDAPKLRAQTFAVRVEGDEIQVGLDNDAT